MSGKNELDPQEQAQLAAMAGPLVDMVVDQARRNAQAVLEATDALKRASSPEEGIAAAAEVYTVLLEQFPKEGRWRVLALIAAFSLSPTPDRIPWRTVGKIARSTGADLSDSYLRSGLGRLRGTLGTNGSRSRELQNMLTRDYLTERLNGGDSYAQIARDVGTDEHTVSRHAQTQGVAHLNQHRRTHR